MTSLRVISADSHVVEPDGLWVQRLDRKFRDRAPRVVENNGRPSLVAPGIDPFPLGGVTSHGRTGEDMAWHMTRGYEAVRPSAWDPVERLKDQDVDGVSAELLYSSLGMPLFACPDAELQRACFSVYNDWIAEFCTQAPDRLVGVALISLEEIAAAVRELERARKKGLKGVMIAGAAPRERPYSRKYYDPFWQAASDLGLPVSLHVTTSPNGDSPSKIAIGEASVVDADAPGSWVTALYFFLPTDVQHSLFNLVIGQVFARFPKLKIVSAENDTGWLPHFIYRLDHACERYGSFGLKEKPSDYLKRQLWATFLDDRIGAVTYGIFGENNYMWGSDFPHSDCTWPNSREVIAKDFAGVPEHVTRKIVCENAARLYGFPANG
jgi:predicted TIM-barrel fold metal-dependent hydrolase